MKQKEKRFNVGDKITIEEIAHTIDHSLLSPDITIDELKKGCKLAEDNKCISVCVRPSDLPIAVELLKDTNVLPTTVIGFPHGTATVESKVFETKDAIEKGAVEVDVVMNIARFLSGEFDYIEDELRQVVEEAHQSDVKVKVIFENHYLTSDEIKKACEISEKAGVDFVKTSTGYAPSGAKIEDLKIMRENVNNNIEVKAAGGVRNLDQALTVLSTGTVRIGTSGTEALLEEAKNKSQEVELTIPESNIDLDSGY